MAVTLTLTATQRHAKAVAAGAARYGADELAKDIATAAFPARPWVPLEMATAQGLTLTTVNTIAHDPKTGTWTFNAA